MTWWQWLLLIWAIGIPISFVLYILMLVGSGGYISSMLVVVRNSILWPVMLPIVFGMYLESR